MKILQIRFKNLNSLVGEWTIDLTHPAYVADGIFAITGPTGAGKSTILDAICLALYGRTPRLSKVNASGNEIMSRQTGDCFAEVTFETQKGRFRCHWSQRRARTKPTGELQAPKHEIILADSGDIVDSSIRGVAERIVDATGMDFDRFTRSMLLAQGGFAAFLQAGPDERAPILEQITGTEIYSRISILVHERLAAARDALGLLEAETRGIAVLDADQALALQRECDAAIQSEAAWAAKVETGRKAVAWLERIAALRREIDGMAAETKALHDDVDAFQTDRERLALARRAATLEGDWATLIAIRGQQEHDREAARDGLAALPGHETAVAAQTEALAAATSALANARDARENAAPTLKEVRGLDAILVTQQTAIADAETACRRDADQMAGLQKALKAEQMKRAAAQRELDATAATLQAHEQDVWLVGGLEGVEAQLRELLDRQKQMADREADRKRADAILAQKTKANKQGTALAAATQAALEKAEHDLQQAVEALQRLLDGRLLRELRAERDALQRERAYLKRIADLEDHRRHLEDGRPCPLCGATEHPFAAGNVPVADDIDKRIAPLDAQIDEAEQQDATLRKLEDAKQVAHRQADAAISQTALAEQARQQAVSALADLDAELARVRTDIERRRAEVFAKLAPLGCSDIDLADPAALLASLRARLKAWNETQRRRDDLANGLVAIDGELRSLAERIDALATESADRRQRLDVRKVEHDTSVARRRALFGERDADVVERELKQAEADAADAERQARDQHHVLSAAWQTARARHESLVSGIARREPELVELGARFAAALAPLGFADEVAFQAARLPAPMRSDLERQERALDARQMDLKARRADREARLAAEAALHVTDEDLGTLAPQCETDAAALQDVRATIAGLRQRLRDDAAARERIRERQAAIEAQQAECRRWSELHELIGSADGKKYRNFAQGLTFELMIRHANLQLGKMSDRYWLVHDPARPLDLNVVDAYQAGEIRSTKNLSGGESFLVSLALALGLSQMTSRNVRVDSLFLDEGFGSLDEDALETALSTLAGLHQDGKLIGLISHVGALKTRIAAQIEVVPRPGGRSVLEGPGCSRR